MRERRSLDHEKKCAGSAGHDDPLPMRAQRASASAGTSERRSGPARRLDVPKGVDSSVLLEDDVLPEELDPDVT